MMRSIVMATMLNRRKIKSLNGIAFHNFGKNIQPKIVNIIEIDHKVYVF